ncbi:meiotic helicase [Ceratocystis lukuohia]|uniref:Meiotic helicase n=1 Tax=Ceratocystis lukuohia TaxID=2019550 RepID=A0ABR4MFK3_9PEZI
MPTPLRLPNTPASSAPGPKKTIAVSLPPGLIHLPGRHNLSTSTVHNLSHLGRAASARDIFEACCKSNDTAHHRIDPSHLSFFAAINASPVIPWHLPVGIKPSLPWHKAFLLVQISLCPAGATPSNITAGARKALAIEKRTVFNHLAVVLRCAADLFGCRADAVGLAATLWLLRCLMSSVWDEPAKELLQVTGVGPKKAEALVAAGVRTTRHFAELDSSHIERLLKRQPPFGEALRRTMAQFPRLTLALRQCGWQRPIRRGTQTAIVEAILDMENECTPRWRGRVLRLVLWGSTTDDEKNLAFFWRGSIVDITKSRNKEQDNSQGLIVRFAVEAAAGQSLTCSLACEEVAGTLVKCAVALV